VILVGFAEVGWEWRGRVGLLMLGGIGVVGLGC
jgi:hypothetical protein